MIRSSCCSSDDGGLTCASACSCSIATIRIRAMARRCSTCCSLDMASNGYAVGAYAALLRTTRWRRHLGIRRRAEPRAVPRHRPKKSWPRTPMSACRGRRMSWTTPTLARHSTSTRTRATRTSTASCAPRQWQPVHRRRTRCRLSRSPTMARYLAAHGHLALRGLDVRRRRHSTGDHRRRASACAATLS
jgi:hypothetical protein